MEEIKKIQVKKRKVSNLSNWEMGDLKGGADTLWGPGYYCLPATGATCDGNINYCESVRQTSPCYTYPYCG